MTYPCHPGEREAVTQAIAAGRKFGYGNVCDRVQMAWALKMLEDYPDWSPETAMLAAHFDKERSSQAGKMSRGDALREMREYTFQDELSSALSAPSAAPKESGR